MSLAVRRLKPTARPARDGRFRDGAILPKENVNDSVTPELRAEVAWKPDGGEGAGYVQIATVHTDSPASIPNPPTNANLSEVTVEGLPPSAMTTSSFDPARTRRRLDGWHVTLDREQINRLIRSLRRARDSAFGADA